MFFSTEMLMSVLVIETTAAILLAILCVSLLRQLNEKTRSKQTLMDHWAEIEKEMAACRTREQDATANLSACREWFHAALNGVHELVLAHGFDENGEPGPFVEANDQACKLLGMDRETLLTRTIADIHEVNFQMMPGFLSAAQVEEQRRQVARKLIRNRIDKVMRGQPISYEDFFRTATGARQPLQLTVLRADFGDKPTIVWIGRDVTEIRKGQRALKEGEKRVQEMFAHTPLGIALFDPDRTLSTVNRTGLRMFGMPDQMEFEAFNLFDNRFLPPDAKQALGRGESVHCEIVVDFDDVRKKGIFSSSRRDKGHFDILISNMGYDSDYRPRGYFAQIDDVTQKRKIEADLRRLQTMAAGPGTPEGISGSLDDVSLTDIVQVFCAGSRSMEIAMENRGVKAQIFIIGGSVTHCVMGDRSGEDAFYELMRWKQGKFTAKHCKEPPASTITVSAVSLLMEGARRFDETPSE